MTAFPKYRIAFVNCILAFMLFAACTSVNKEKESEAMIMKSPDGELVLSLLMDRGPALEISRKGEVVLESIALGISRKDAEFGKNLKLTSVSEPEEVQEKYSLHHGKQVEISYLANRKTYHFENEKSEKVDVICQLSNDGLAFRYFFPDASDSLKYIVSEHTAYSFSAESRAWLQPLSRAKTGWQSTNPSYEEHYMMEVKVDTPSPIEEGWVYPALFRSKDSWVLISEAGLSSNYCGSHLLPDSSAPNTLKVGFPQKEEYINDGALNPESVTPWHSPWRIIAIGDLATIVESTLGTDVAEPAQEGDFAFVKPGIASWSWIMGKDPSVIFPVQKNYIDFAAEMNWDYCLVDADWDRNIGYDSISDLVAYGKEKGVKLLLWYNSAGDWNTTPYTPKSALLTAEKREAEFSKLHEIGIAGIKVDFFGGDGQSVIAYYQDILRDAAKHELMVNFHGATLPRGWHRTYPNLMTVEAVKGFEFITFSQADADKAATHCAMLPFARNVFDPMDFTPMNFSGIPPFDRKTSAAFELATAVLFTSGIQHLAESPEGMGPAPRLCERIFAKAPYSLG